MAIHLLQVGIMKTYIEWVEHGEPRVLGSSGDDRGYDYQMEVNDDEGIGGIDALVEDRVRG